MSCTIIPHTRFEDAVDLLAAELDRDQSADPLAVRTLLVQGGVVGRWLSTELALRSRHGIAAGLDLRPVGGFCRKLVAPPGRQDPYTLESLIWTVDAALEDAAWIAGLRQGEALRAALVHLDRAGRHALAIHLAGILDRYQLERPDWIRAWSGGAAVAEAAEAPWLGALWTRILAKAGGLAPLSLRIEALIAALAAGTPPPADCPRTLWVLAPSTLPPLLIRLLTALGDHPAGIAVQVLHLVPATHASMWAALDNEPAGYDPETTPLAEPLAGAHPLLAAFARQSHDLGVLLAEVGDGRTRTIDFDALLERTVPADASLLVQLQHQVWNAAAGPLHLRAGDRSLSVHRCHSPLREVEVLRDALVDALTAVDGPRPDQVLVAVADLDTYAPLLSALLGEERGDAVGFPVRVVGRSAAADPLIDALLAVLALPGSEASLEQVLAPLEAPAIRRRFGLDEGDLAILRHRLESAGISWGLDGRHRGRVAGYPAGEGSWRSGVDRLLLGLTSGVEGTVLPGRHPAGSSLLGEAAALGGIAVYLEILLRFAEAVGDGGAPQPITVWRRLLFGLLGDLADAKRGADAKSVGMLRGAIAAIPADAADPDLRTVRKHLQRMLADEGGASTWSRGGVTVAPLSALRHAPHAVIAVLGLDSAFPRVGSASTFDPAARHRRRGDRSQRLDDRQTFLDLLLAARSRLHLSWTGCAVEDGSPRESSAVVEDLLRCLDRQLSDPRGRAAVLVGHRLHASDPAYFDGTLPRSHDRLACAAAKARNARDAGEQEPAVPPFLTAAAELPLPALLSPADLVAWCSDPGKAFAEAVLGLRFPRQETLPDHEPIVLDGLENWELRQRLLEDCLAGRQPDEGRLRADGVLPHGPAGGNLLIEIGEEAAAIATTLARELPGRQDLLRLAWPVDVALPGAGTPLRIAGGVARCDGRVALCLHGGALHGRHLLGGWVLHQLLNAQARACGAEEVATLILGKATEKPAKANPLDQGCCRLHPDSATAAHWDAIGAALRASWRRPLPVFPDLAAACWGWKSGDLSSYKLADHVRAWQQGADEDGEGFQRSELAAPKAWTRLIWRGVADPTSGWAETFLQPLWLPAALAAAETVS